jgi:hypothetical protein
MTLDGDALWEALYPAAWKLARSADSIHERIGAAFAAIHSLSGEDFPPEQRLRFNDIVTRMTVAGAVRGTDGGLAKGAVDNTLASMPDDEATEIAEEIFELFVAVAEIHFRD